MGQGNGLELDHSHLMPNFLSVQQAYYFFRKLVSVRLDYKLAAAFAAVFPAVCRNGF